MQNTATWGHVFAHLNSMMSLIDLTTGANHSQAEARLGRSHSVLASDDHRACRDWFECLLKTNKMVLREESRTSLDYFNGMVTNDCVLLQMYTRMGIHIFCFHSM